MAPRIKRFDANQLQYAGFDFGQEVAPERFLPRCDFCASFATRGLRAAGMMHVRDPMLIWSCFRHRTDAEAMLADSLHPARQHDAEPAYSTAAQDEGAAGASPGKGRSDSRAGSAAVIVPAKSVNVVTGSGGDPLPPGPDNDAFDDSL